MHGRVLESGIYTVVVWYLHNGAIADDSLARLHGLPIGHRKNAGPQPKKCVYTRSKTCAMHVPHNTHPK